MLTPSPARINIVYAVSHKNARAGSSPDFENFFVAHHAQQKTLQCSNQ